MDIFIFLMMVLTFSKAISTIIIHQPAIFLLARRLWIYTDLMDKVLHVKINLFF